MADQARAERGSPAPPPQAHHPRTPGAAAAAAGTPPAAARPGLSEEDVGGEEAEAIACNDHVGAASSSSGDIIVQGPCGPEDVRAGPQGAAPFRSCAAEEERNIQALEVEKQGRHCERQDDVEGASTGTTITYQAKNKNIEDHPGRKNSTTTSRLLVEDDHRVSTNEVQQVAEQVSTHEVSTNEDSSTTVRRITAAAAGTASPEGGHHPDLAHHQDHHHPADEVVNIPFDFSVDTSHYKPPRTHQEWVALLNRESPNFSPNSIPASSPARSLCRYTGQRSSCYPGATAGDESSCTENEKTAVGGHSPGDELGTTRTMGTTPGPARSSVITTTSAVFIPGSRSACSSRATSVGRMKHTTSHLVSDPSNRLPPITDETFADGKALTFEDLQQLPSIRSNLVAQPRISDEINSDLMKKALEGSRSMNRLSHEQKRRRRKRSKRLKEQSNDLVEQEQRRSRRWSFAEDDPRTPEGDHGDIENATVKKETAAASGATSGREEMRHQPEEHELSAAAGGGEDHLQGTTNADNGGVTASRTRRLSKELFDQRRQRVLKDTLDGLVAGGREPRAARGGLYLREQMSSNSNSTDEDDFSNDSSGSSVCSSRDDHTVDHSRRSSSGTDFDADVSGDFATFYPSTSSERAVAPLARERSNSHSAATAGAESGQADQERHHPSTTRCASSTTASQTLAPTGTAAAPPTGTAAARTVHCEESIPYILPAVAERPPVLDTTSKALAPTGTAAARTVHCEEDATSARPAARTVHCEEDATSARHRGVDASTPSNQVDTVLLHAKELQQRTYSTHEVDERGSCTLSSRHRGGAKNLPVASTSSFLLETSGRTGPQELQAASSLSAAATAAAAAAARTGKSIIKPSKRFSFTTSTSTALSEKNFCPTGTAVTSRLRSLTYSGDKMPSDYSLARSASDAEVLGGTVYSRRGPMTSLSGRSGATACSLFDEDLARFDLSRSSSSSSSSSQTRAARNYNTLSYQGRSLSSRSATTRMTLTRRISEERDQSETKCGPILDMHCKHRSGSGFVMRKNLKESMICNAWIGRVGRTRSPFVVDVERVSC
ncbi:unnamed protein product [Amoebophrya sp. A120]|nr:unnamed protein product [Amoebophrya sp. A120]|eukprot:GSA120T00013452001.1